MKYPKSCPVLTKVEKSPNMTYVLGARCVNGVGLDGNHPQVYYLPDNPPQGNGSFGENLEIQEASKSELEEMKKEVQDMLERFDKGFTSIVNSDNQT